ncbi:MAG: carboxy terminal-processing peptidase [Gammaproteobacteria bacterium]|nr:carboxy terminal-processing peptidase [Gammaproteobacteria bacterium]
MANRFDISSSAAARQLPRSLVLTAALAFAGSSGTALATVSAENKAVTDEIAALAPLPVHSNTTRNIVDALSSRHYVTTELNDLLSEQIYQGFLEDLDPSKSYLLASDIAEFDSLRYQLDDTLLRGDAKPAFIIFNRYHQRVLARFESILAQLEKGTDVFDFERDESLELDREEAPWATNNAELDDLWRRRLKNAVLNLRLADKEPEKIQELLLKRYKNRLTRTRQTNSEDVYQLYMNAFTRTYDPHTQYFSPRTSENFNINMSLSLEGIGAVLQQEDEFTRVVSLVPAGPADKSKQVFPDDKIVAVAQGLEGEMIDVIGWRLDEVVQLIRGKKDTIVRLDVIPASSTDSSESKIVKIVRNTVKLEEQSAKSEIIEVEQFGHKRKIGVIDIPAFYIDFQALQKGEKDFKSTTRDVKVLLADLMAEGVEGVVIDLRNNGGGSLQEARTLTGLFIDRGPTVQIRSKSNRVDILNDRDIRTIYDGPLAVLVNRLSASASEIFAGAMQDYERGVIIGSQTFGKGTVQSLLPMNRGQLKLTQAKFYRISGESTQHKGIIPDISFPSNFDLDSIGESTLDGPLPWDQISATSFRTKQMIGPLVTELDRLHKARVTEDPEFTYMADAAAYRKVRAQQTAVTLNESQRLKEKEDSDTFWLALENTKRLQQGLPEIDSLDELQGDKEPVVAEIDGSGATGITTDAESGDLGEGDAALGEAQNLVGNELAGVIEMPSATAPPATLKQENPEKEGAEPDIEDTTENEEPDAFLVETTNILLDLISLGKQTAAEKQEQRQI